MKIDLDYAETRDLYRALRTHRLQIRKADCVRAAKLVGLNGGEYIRRLEAIEDRLHHHLYAIEKAMQVREPRALVPVADEPDHPPS